MVNSRLLSAAALLAQTLCCGCLAPRGLLVTYSTVPYHLPMEKPAVRASKRCWVEMTQLREPLTAARLSVLWGSQAATDAAARADMTELRYADLQTLSLLNGIYIRRRLIFYGE